MRPWSASNTPPPDSQPPSRPPADDRRPPTKPPGKEHLRNVASGRVTIHPDGTFTVNLTDTERTALTARLRRYRRNRITAERGGDWR